MLDCINTLGVPGKTFELLVGETEVTIPISKLTNGRRRLCAAMIGPLPLSEGVGEVVEGDEFAPHNLTSNNSAYPPILVRAWDYFYGYKYYLTTAYYLFDGEFYSGIVTGSFNYELYKPGWELHIGDPKRVFKYGVLAISPYYSPNGWILYGRLSPEEDLEVLDVQSGLTMEMWEQYTDTPMIFELSNDAKLIRCSEFQMHMTGGNEPWYGDSIINEIYLYEAIVASENSIKISFGRNISIRTTDHVMKEGDPPMFLVGEDALKSVRFIREAIGGVSKVCITPFYR